MTAKRKSASSGAAKKGGGTTKEKPAPAPSAAASRAAREEWSEADLQARSSQAKALRILRRHYRQYMPGHVGAMVGRARLGMLQTIVDCTALDQHLADRGEAPRYMSDFATFHSEGALRGLHCLAIDSLTKARKKPTPMQSAFKNGDERTGTAKFILHRVRERLRDGWNLDQTIQLESDQITKMAREGNSAFFANLGEIMKDRVRKPKSFERTTTGWILRAWLPLCLWECAPDGSEAYGRCMDAADLIGIPMPPEIQFITAWRNVRNRVIKQNAPH
jgi:hypothetical protein